MFRPVKQFWALTVYDRATLGLIYSAAQLAVERGFQFSGKIGRGHLAVVMPSRRRGIQYAVPVVRFHRERGVLDHPPSRRMTSTA